jgi:hypothetical protein
MTDGFPEYTDSFLGGQDIMYGQFNNVNFYVEDKDQEHFYYNILKNLFPDIQFNKIFPLNGKKNVKDDAKLNIGVKTKVYIADLDFDDILECKEEIENVFYLEKYSIENYLFSKKSIYELIREKDPKLKDSDIDTLLDYDNLIKQSEYLAELASSFVLIQKHSLGMTYFGLNPTRDFDFTTSNTIYRNNFIEDYFNSVEVALKNVNHRYKLKSRISSLKNHFDSIIKLLANIPGKYILNLFKDRLEKMNLILQTNLETFTYKLSKGIEFQELDFLKNRINIYVQ